MIWRNGNITKDLPLVMGTVGGLANTRARGSCIHTNNQLAQHTRTAPLRRRLSSSSIRSVEKRTELASAAQNDDSPSIFETGIKGSASILSLSSALSLPLPNATCYLILSRHSTHTQTPAPVTPASHLAIETSSGALVLSRRARTNRARKQTLRSSLAPVADVVRTEWQRPVPLRRG